MAMSSDYPGLEIGSAAWRAAYEADTQKLRDYRDTLTASIDTHKQMQAITLRQMKGARRGR